MVDWGALREREAARYRDGESRLGDGSDERQRQLTRMGNAAWGAGLCLLMAAASESDSENHSQAASRESDSENHSQWLHRAAERWRESYADAPPGSWGRPIGAIKALVLAGDWAGAEEASQWALGEGGGEAESPIGRYAAALSCAVLGDREHTRIHADAIRI